MSRDPGETFAGIVVLAIIGVVSLALLYCMSWVIAAGYYSAKQSFAECPAAVEGSAHVDDHIQTLQF